MKEKKSVVLLKDAVDMSGNFESRQVQATWWISGAMEAKVLAVNFVIEIYFSNEKLKWFFLP